LILLKTPPLKDFVNGLFKPSETLDLHEVVKRLKTQVEAIGDPDCKGLRVGKI
jgi:hypothetical protein